MKIITIVLDSNKLENPDLDLRYNISDRIEEITNKRILHDGFDYMGEHYNIMSIFHRVEEERDGDIDLIIHLLKTEQFLENDLSKTAIIYIKDDYPMEGGDFSDCIKVFPN